MNIIRSRKQQAGLGMVEIMATLAVTATLTGLGAPAMKQLKERQQLRAFSQVLTTDLQQARSEAVQRNASVQFSLVQKPGGACYVMYTGDRGDCTCEDDGAPVCKGEAQLLKSEWLPQSRKLMLRSNAQTLTFNARQGTVTPTASIEMGNAGGDLIRQVISIAGRIRTCTPNASVSGIPKC